MNKTQVLALLKENRNDPHKHLTSEHVKKKLAC